MLRATASIVVLIAIVTFAMSIFWWLAKPDGDLLAALAFAVVGTLFLAIPIVALCTLGWWLLRRRQRALRRLAAELGLQYVPRDDLVPNRYSFLDELGQGEDPHAYNVLRGTYRGCRVQVFDYHSGVEDDEDITVLLLEQEAGFPSVRIRPEDFVDRIGQMLGFEDIDFESAEFSRAFAVKSADRKFAYDVCHPRMMEFLLEHRDVSLEIEGPCIAMTVCVPKGGDRRRTLKPAEIPDRLEQLVEIRELFPQYLYQN